MIEIKKPEALSDKTLQSVDDLIGRIQLYNPNGNFDLIRKAYACSEKAHSGQVRRSGEPYINHPLNVAGILADLHMDMVTIAVGLLHDTVEDTKITLEDLKREFGETICLLVDGVTKISQMTFRNTHEKQGENVRKMIVAMGKDIRVILVKLADRLHNMRTLNHMPYHKQAIIAQETLDIYAPLANRLGISAVKVELEDLSFRFLQPDAYYDLAQKVAKKKKEREKFIDEFQKLLASELNKTQISFEVQGRSKHFYSIYRKMQSQGIDYEQVFDVMAFRVVVATVAECYAVLGFVHSIWKPIPGRIKDFIAMPKANNYQSLHTTVIGPEGERIEIQIRTSDMHLVAERGVAAHWKYKEKGEVDNLTAEKFSGLRELMSWHRQVNNPDEFLETIKMGLFESEIYVFTPKGDVKEFPEGATPIDFAYSIHTDLGNHIVAARVNGKIVPLRHRLKNGDTIEIITSKSQMPSKDWLKFCVTNRAKAKIRAVVKQEQRKRALLLGQELLEKEFRKFGMGYQKYFKGEPFEQYLKDIGAHETDEVYIRVGYGKLEPKAVLERLAPDDLKQAKPSAEDEEGFFKKVFKSAATKKKKHGSIIQVDGMSDVLVHFARCCNPIPGDSIVAFMTRGRGITVHRADCPRAFEMDQMRRVEVEWSSDQGEEGQERVVRIRVVSHDVPGLLKSMSEAISSFGCNINNANIRTTRDKKAVSIFDITVKDTVQLSQIIQEMQKIKGIIGVTRMTHL